MMFWQKQQIRLAERLLKWQYEKKGRSLPEAVVLRLKSQILIEEVQRIAQRTGRNIIAIVKELIQDFQR